MERTIWAMFYAGIVSIKHHPRNTEPVDLAMCAREADLMFAEWQRRFPWRGLEQSSEE